LRLTWLASRDSIKGMKRTNWTREQPLDPPDDGLDDDERYAREVALDREADRRTDEMRDRDLREEGR
jgi:hypothetical protein